MSDLFARVRPLVGEALAARQVAVVGSPTAATLVKYLVACGVHRWLALPDHAWLADVLAQLRERLDKEIDLAVTWADSPVQLGAADVAVVVDDAALAMALPETLARLAIFTPTIRQSGWSLLALPGESLTLPRRDDAPQAHAGWCAVAPLLALAVRALLLHGTDYAMPTWDDAWAAGKRVYMAGAVDDPTRAMWHVPPLVPTIPFHTPPRCAGTLMIVGLGSLGSVAAQQLAPWVERLVLVDPDRVEVVNLVRQAYMRRDVGKAKAAALADALCAAHPALACEAVIASLTDDEQVAGLLQRMRVTAALVTTGTHADFAIARALRAAPIPHVVGRCYARARFWEGIVVDGAVGPSYEQMRRGVAAGPTPAPEAQTAYGAPGEFTGALTGEPATAMETGWAALWLARLMVQMMMPAALRERWLLARLAAGANCLVGGVVVEAGETGLAYGVRMPGEVNAWSVAEIG